MDHNSPKKLKYENQTQIPEQIFHLENIFTHPSQKLYQNLLGETETNIKI